MNHLLRKLAVIATSFKSYAPRIRAIWGILKEFAPYPAIEFLLPGGSVLAIDAASIERGRSHHIQR